MIPQRSAYKSPGPKVIVCQRQSPSSISKHTALLRHPLLGFEPHFPYNFLIILPIPIHYLVLPVSHETYQPGMVKQTTTIFSNCCMEECDIYYFLHTRVLRCQQLASVTVLDWGEESNPSPKMHDQFCSLGSLATDSCGFIKNQTLTLPLMLTWDIYFVIPPDFHTTHTLI